MFCELRAGHAGMHEARQYPVGVVSAGHPAYWPQTSPEPGAVLDRDQAHDVLKVVPTGTAANTEYLLDRLAACVRPAAIDRDALTALIHRIQEETDGDADLGDWTPQYVAEFIALVRPAPAGVTLTPEDVGIVRWLLMYWGADDEEARKAAPPSRESIRALAARLEAGAAS